MSEIMQFLNDTYPPLIVIFTVSNLAIMGLQVKSAEVVAGLKQPKTLAAIFVWGWVLGPALALLIVWALPLSDPFVVGLLLFSLAPCAPFFPLMVPKARGDMSFAGALVPLVAVGTVIFMPLMAPLLIKGLALSSWALAKMLLVTVLLPLVVGVVLREYARTVATKIFPTVNVIAKLSTLGCLVFGLVLYWREMLATAGSLGLLSMTIFMVVMGVITYRRFGFGLKQNQRSVMSLSMLSRNGSVVMLAVITIPDVEPSLLTYVIMFIIWSVIIAAIAARIFGKLAGKTAEEDSNMRFFLLGLKALFVANHTTDSLDTIKKRLASKEAVLIDVREPKEWEDGHLEAAKLVPLSDIRYSQKRKVATKDLSKKEIIYCHCRSGKRVLIATDYLTKDGYDIRPLKQGYKDLLSAGFEKAKHE